MTSQPTTTGPARGGPAATPRSVFGEWIVLRESRSGGDGSPALAATRAAAVTRALRGAVMRHAADPPPAMLAGHYPDGRPLDRPHAAYLALPHRREPGDDCRIAGVAVVLPRDVGEADRQAVLLALSRWQQGGLRLLLGRHGAMRLAPLRSEAHLGPLDPSAWVGRSRRWASVTPVALDRNPGDLFARNARAAEAATRRAEATLARACERIGLPRPETVRLGSRPFLEGVPSAARFGPFAGNGTGLRRLCVHAELVFREPVEGPLLLGAGRFFGMGLCAPVAWSAAYE